MRRNGDSDRRRFRVVRGDGDQPRRKDRLILVIHTEDDPLLALFFHGAGGKTLVVDGHVENFRFLFAIPNKFGALFPALARLFG